MKNVDKILQGALLENNLLTRKDLDLHLQTARQQGQSLKDYLTAERLLTEKQILIALSQSLRTEFVNFSDLKVDQAVLAKVPTKFAWYYKILPITFNRNLLTVATSTPLDVKMVDELRVNLGADIEYVLGEEHHLIEALKRHYGLASDTIDRILTNEPERQTRAIDNGQWIEDLEQTSEDPTVSHLVNRIILEAYQMRATDIHIEPYRDKVRFRYRIDGVLVDANLPERVKVFLPQILSRIKILANLSITEKRLPQDGSAVVKTNEQQLDLRISTMPTPRGESIVVRILPTKVRLLSLENLGFNPDSVSKFRDIIKKPHGIVFITGPTGSGKTTTLYACLNEINSSTRKIITIEDPVEYEMDGITQVQVNPKVEFHFATGLRSILRHDPDIIMVGEVRDPETAEIAIKTALTGHLVFSTLHTNDASSGITRLIDMGIESYLVASSVEAFVAQRLVRVICPECKTVDESCMPGVKSEIARSLGLSEQDEITIYRGAGCDHCNQTGYYGRIAVYEILMLDDVIRAAVLDKPRSDHIKRIAMRRGLKTLRQNGWKAVLDGITTPDEVVNVTVKDESIEELAGTATPAGERSAGEAATPLPTRSGGNGLPQSAYQQRIYPRINTPAPFSYRRVRRPGVTTDPVVEYGEERQAMTHDLSAGGMCFYCDEEIKVGAVLEIELTLTGEETRCIHCLSRVCRSGERNDSQDARHRVCVYFLDMTTEDRRAVSQYIQKILSSATNPVHS